MYICRNVNTVTYKSGNSSATTMFISRSAKYRKHLCIIYLLAMMCLNIVTSNHQHYPEDMTALSNTSDAGPSVPHTLPVKTAASTRSSSYNRSKESSGLQTFLFLKEVDTERSLMVFDNSTAATVVVPRSSTVMIYQAPTTAAAQFEDHRCFNIATMLLHNNLWKSLLQILKLMDGASDPTPSLSSTQINSSDHELPLHSPPLLTKISAVGLTLTDNIALGDPYIRPPMFGEEVIKWH